MGAIMDTATDTVTVMVSATDITDTLMVDITDTMVTISENDPPMPKLHLMPMPPHTTTAITDTVTDTDITDIPMELMADTVDITDILMLMELTPHTTPDIMPPMPYP